MKNSTIIGVDLAKNSFAVLGLKFGGQELWRKTVRRQGLKRLLARLEPSVVAMEACGGAHYWGRLARTYGHTPVLLPPQHVKGYLRGQKNDYNDARAIAEACLHGSIRTVPVKTSEQQDEQAFHAIRRALKADTTRLVNQMRGLLAEHGVTVAQTVAAFRKRVPELLEDGENALTPLFRALLSRQYQRLLALEEELAWYDQQLEKQVKKDEVCQRLDEVPGIGPVVASALKSWMGDGKQFTRGRDASAALGLVPRQHSTGGRQRLHGITKRGDRYIRSLVVHGARSVASKAAGKEDALSRWVERLKATRGYNKAVVALANKLVRIAWVIVARQERYQPRQAEAGAVC